MLFFKKRGLRVVMALVLVVVLVLQMVATTALADGGWNKTVLVDVSRKPTKALISEVRKLLPAAQSILSQETTKELLSQGLNQKSPGLVQAIQLLDESLEKYYAYENEASETVLQLKAAIDFIRSELDPSRQASQLLISAVVMTSWLEFKQGEINAARERLKNIIAIAGKSEINFDYYPSHFRKFASGIQKKTEDQLLSKLAVASDPAAVNVYVDGVYVGVAPLSLSLKAGEYDIAWEASGRDSVVKKVKLTPGRAPKIRAKLPWSKEPRGGDWLTDGWHKKAGSSQVALASRVAELTQTDVAIFFDLMRIRGGYVAAAKIYNARFSQLVETIYSEQISAFKAEEVKRVTEDLARKITPHLKSKDLTYWSKGVDRSVVVDYRVANRGKKPLYKKPAFWMTVGGVVITGVTLGILAAQDQEESATTGGIVLGF